MIYPQVSPQTQHILLFIFYTTLHIVILRNKIEYAITTIMDTLDTSKTLGLISTAKIVGLSESMIRYLIRADVFVPIAHRQSKAHPRGKKLSFNYEDIVYLRILKSLLDQKVEVKLIRKSQQLCSLNGLDFYSEILRKNIFVVSKSEILLRTEKELYEDLTNGQFAMGAILVNTREFKDDVDSEYRKRTNQPRK